MKFDLRSVAGVQRFMDFVSREVYDFVRNNSGVIWYADSVYAEYSDNSKLYCDMLVFCRDGEIFAVYDRGNVTMLSHLISNVDIHRDKNGRVKSVLLNGDAGLRELASLFCGEWFVPVIGMTADHISRGDDEIKLVIRDSASALHVGVYEGEEYIGTVSVYNRYGFKEGYWRKA